MRLDAAASSCVRPALAGPAQPATWLGVTTRALYLRTPSAPGVLALVARDAVRLPCALLLPTTAAELPLTSIAHGAVGDAMVGAGCVAWNGPAGPVVVRAVREWAPAMVPTAPARVRSAPARLQPEPERRRCGSAAPLATTDPHPRRWAAAGLLAALRDALPAAAALGIDAALLTRLATEPTAAVVALLGRGPGLTPAGDDVLAGFLLGARVFGLDASAVSAAVATMAPARTTALSAALLWHAARGECIDEVADVIADPSAAAVGRLLRVGHTSGAALATGLSTAALAALQTVRAGEAA